jgi:O-acetylserine/cysteine efflux transporter
MKLRDILLAVFVTFAWGSYFTASKIILVSFPPFLTGGLRFFLLFLITCPFIFKDKIPFKLVLLLACIYFVNVTCLYNAISTAENISPMIFIYQLNIPISILLSLFIFKEKMLITDYIGLLLAFIGLALITNIAHSTQVSFKAVILSISAAFLFASYNMVAKKLSSFNLFALLAQLSLISFPMFFLSSYYSEEWPSLDAVQLISIAGLLYKVIICSFLANFTWFYLLNKYQVSQIMPFALLTPLFGCVVTAILLGEKVSSDTIFGGLCIMFGVAIIEIRRSYGKKML